MRRSLALRQVAAALALAWAGRAAADLNLSGSGTFGYARQDNTNSAGDRSSGDSYDWGLALSLGGMPFRPGLLTWGASASYAQLRSVYGGATSGLDGLGYGLSLSLLDANPLALNLSASRSRTEFTEGGSARSGSTLGSTESAGLILAFPNVPRLTAQLSHSEMSSRGFGRDDIVDEGVRLRTSLADHVGPIHYSMDYNTAWNSGTFAESNYRGHSLALSASGALPNAYVSFSGAYVLRLPTVESPFNPRFDDDALGGSVSWQWGDKLSPAVSYSYAHALITAPDTPAREGMSHGFAQSLEYRYRPDLRLTQTLSVSYTAQRVGTDQVQTAAESLGGGVRWSIPVFPSAKSTYTLSLGGGASMGLVQAADVDRVTGYSVNGTASFAQGSASGSAQLAYSIAYADNFGIAGGQRFAHELRLEADTVPVSRLQLRVSLIGRSARESSPLMGSSANRSITGTALGAWNAYTFSLSGGFTDGLSAAVRDLGLADGLIWAPDYDTHSRFVTASGTARFGRLSLTGVVSWVSNSGPGRPGDEEIGATASLGWSLGLFSLTAQDTYSTGDSGGVTHSGNLFLVRLSRSFGWHF